jgi:hypothetical protein
MSDAPDIVAELGRWLVGEKPYDHYSDRVMVRRARDEILALREALDESVKLQSHYAALLNDYDGGKRLQFATADDWLERLRTLKGAASIRALKEKP